MRNVKLVMAYDGTDFCGWQTQPDAPSIQGTLATAIGRITGEKVLPQGSGRTDAGVHALAQVATFRSESRIPVANLVIALNDILPGSIRVLEACEVAADFHPRTAAKSKTYRYRLYRPAICPPFFARYVWHHPYPLHFETMQEAAARIEGEHDFTSFAAVDPEKPRGRREVEAGGKPGEYSSGTSNVRTIFSSIWRQEGDELMYEVRGSGFLHHMVRNLVGTFLLVGKGTIHPEDVIAILRARNRSLAGATVPARGLYLVNVEY
ncbi:MAG: tRNA pseudouridine(38-40) synthase TruA [Acidobacteria bacterium]|nr:tRNA pseudouridine(38-40) synthase TruA [Acidobacteriota bacterium]